ncbi:hypothetical protein HID58_019249, partial [Brassica napus]
LQYIRLKKLSLSTASQGDFQNSLGEFRSIANPVPKFQAFIMQSENQSPDPNQDNYQQADPTKIIWKALQDLKLGADKERWIVHEDAQKKFAKDHRLCLVAKGLNPFHQNPAGIKVALPRIWQLVGKVERQINDDGTVNFYYQKEHHLHNVLEKQRYTYRGWIVALDRWSNRNHPSFLREIPFKVRIYNLPDMYRRHGMVESIGSKLGYVDEVSIIEPSTTKEAEVWVKILFDEDDVITLARTVELLKDQPPVELEFRYLGLQKFCMLCGSLKHGYEACDVSPQLQQRQYELMDIGSNPYVTAQQRSAAIEEYITSREAGQSSGTAVSEYINLNQSHDNSVQTDQLNNTEEQERTVGTVTLVQEVLPTPRGTSFQEMQQSHLEQPPPQHMEILPTPPEQGTKWKKVSLFRYDMRWRLLPDFNQVIEQAWNQDCANVTYGDIHAIINKCRKALSIWRSKKNTNSQKDLLAPCLTRWDISKLRALFHPEYIPKILSIRLSITGAHDTAYWMYSKTGAYTVKTGYHIQKAIDKENAHNQVPSDPVIAQRDKYLYNLWNLKIPPKIKLFWWKCIHNGLPVAENLNIRGCRVYRYCQLCGEEVETVKHMLFGCRVAREAWKLSLLNTCPQFDHLNTTLSLLQELMERMQQGITDTLPFYLGWRLWKMCNKLVYENKRDHITQVIHAAIMDKQLWEEAQNHNSVNNPQHSTATQSQIAFPLSSFLHSLPQRIDHFCIVDASWKSPEDQAGIGWSLTSIEGTPRFQGSSAIEPTSSSLVAEAMAMLLAVQQAQTLRYDNVTFIGNCGKLFKCLRMEAMDGRMHATYINEATSIVKDIVSIAKQNSFSFLHVPRHLVVTADQLAKKARWNKQQYMFSIATSSSSQLFNFQNSPKSFIPVMSAASGFKTLTENFTVKVRKAENRELNVPLLSPFTIASSRLDSVGNVAIRIELSGGCVGWGEAPILPSVTAEDQLTAMVKSREACELLKELPEMKLGHVLEEIGGILPGHRFASVRAGVEMAMIDAAAKSVGVPLWKLFGGASNTITTDITIPIVSPAEASYLAAKYREEGFKTLKLKVGKNLRADIEVLQAIREIHPTCSFILDANEGYNTEEAVEVLQKLHEMKVTPVLFEQPVHRDNWEGLRHVTRVAKDRFGVSVAADESCRDLTDLKKIIKDDVVDVVNIKLAKSGVLEALEVIELARSSGIGLMIGGMVETRLAMGFSGHLAAGIGCFRFIDLDTPLLLASDPVQGGYKALGAVYEFTDEGGHGGYLH